MDGTPAWMMTTGRGEYNRERSSLKKRVSTTRVSLTEKRRPNGTNYASGLTLEAFFAFLGEIDD